MMTLEQLNYKLEGEAFVKHIDNYKITLFPSDRGYIRRIIKDNRVIDMKKVSIENLEADKAFMDILRNRRLSVQQAPTVTMIGEEIIFNAEVDLVRARELYLVPEVFLEQDLTQEEINLDEVEYESN